MNLGVTVACVGLILQALFFAATHPMGAVVQCRDAIAQARMK